MKYILYLILAGIVLHAADSAFTASKKQSLLIKKIILEEESIAKAYEQYLIDKKEIPTYDDLKSSDYLLETFPSTLFDDENSISIEISERTATIPSNKSITNRLVGSNYEDSEIFQKLYESNIFRKKTYINNSNSIEILLEDGLAKHLYYLITKSGKYIPECLPKTDESKYCIENNHIKVYLNKEREDSKFLMSYHIDNFQKGPIIITADEDLQKSDEFREIPTGAVLYDLDAVKYIKTFDTVEELM